MYAQIFEPYVFGTHKFCHRRYSISKALTVICDEITDADDASTADRITPLLQDRIMRTRNKEKIFFSGTMFVVCDFDLHKMMSLTRWLKTYGVKYSHNSIDLLTTVMRYFVKRSSGF